MLGSKKKEEAFPVNEALLNVITPMGLEIKRNSLVIGENLGKVYGAVRYPQKVDMGWLSKITNIPSTIVSVGITPIDNGSLISAISKSIVQQRGAADSAKDPLTRQRAEKAAEDGEKIMQRIDQEGETVAMMSLTVMPIAQDEVNFTKVCRRVESAFNIQKCKVRTLANLQKEGFQSISPTYPANSTVDSIVSRIIPMSTFVGGFPFASSGYNDGRGYYFAKDSNGGLVILDTWERGNDRTNSSFVIMGVAGIGKSTVVKHIMLSEYMKGTKILCIDPESEYKDMCRNLNGSWLNAGGGKNGRSNLLQIRPAPRDDDDETDKLYMQRAFSSELKPRARLVLQVLVLHCNKEGECFPSIKTIAAKCGYGVSTVKRVLDELVKAGYIVKQARFDERKNGGQTSNLYTLCSDLPCTDEPENAPVPEDDSSDESPAVQPESAPADACNAPDPTPGEQSATLPTADSYSFADGFETKIGRQFCRPIRMWTGGQSIFIPP